MQNMKKLFQTPRIEAMPFKLEDIMTLSGDEVNTDLGNNGGPIVLPIIPA